MNNMTDKPRLVFDFIRPPTQRLKDVERGLAPRESLLGFIQLRDRGWPISVSDDRWTGTFGAIRQKFNFRLEIPSLQMIRHWYKADIVIVTTRISLVLAVIAKSLGKKIVFLDSLCEEVPKYFWRRWVAKQALRIADACICLSASQAKHWSSRLKISEDAFTPIHYGVDHDFYQLPTDHSPKASKKPYLLAVGRDPRRDFSTLVAAADKLDWDVKLVTKPYLVPQDVKRNSRVEVFDDLSYEQLFRLYADASIVVVPVKQGTTYMSGIRATMEAMLLGAPVVASRVSGMEDYFQDGSELLYFTPENPASLVETINKIVTDKALKNSLVLRSQRKVINAYSVSNYADSLENVFRSLYIKKQLKVSSQYADDIKK